MFVSWVITIFTLLFSILYYSDQVDNGTLFHILFVYTYIKLLSTSIWPGIPTAVGLEGTWLPVNGALPVTTVNAVNEPVVDVIILELIVVPVYRNVVPSSLIKESVIPLPSYAFGNLLTVKFGIAPPNEAVGPIIILLALLFWSTVVQLSDWPSHNNEALLWLLPLSNTSKPAYLSNGKYAFNWIILSLIMTVL